ncbi:AraC family transcriptional regulator [Flammeovirga sp. MY04]|uniref:helix-turn-helix domain-containing protein n=1 Tax=Flammeovirga sp. MY04 TaxID=1191459 RepID=UPI000806341E|nr:helix-turn-helix domain-containing protein [Flammeovirga sp. MY04]ANQ50654.1 AraC family transcriptional regulator [Flammeovirga sp. MY04]
MKFEKPTGEYLEILDLTSNCDSSMLNQNEGKLSVIWFTSDNNTLIIDGRERQFDHNEIIFLTEFHQVEKVKINTAKFVRFNKSFYCIVNHDSEVGCKGVLFFGSNSIPRINLSNEDGEMLISLWKIFEYEMKSADELQLEMLQMLLKRLLILCTRILKKQTALSELEDDKLTIVKEFNYLVEQHFKEKKTVAEYADLLNKSPKTLSNVFKLLGQKTPLQFIQERILLEARRQIIYTDQSISEIAFELGYDDIQAFSRFFKKAEGSSPSEYRTLQTKKVS